MAIQFKYLDEKNALALLPIDISSLEEIEFMLQAIDNGERGGIKGSISKLIKINKLNRHTKKSWGRLKDGNSVDLVVSYTFMTFDEQDDPDRYYYSYEAWQHGTPQSPMLMLSFDRNSGAPPPEGKLEQEPGAYVISRRVVSVPIQCILKNWGNAESGYMIYEHNISAMDHAIPQFTSASYIGLTSRNWHTRYAEHKRDALSGSGLIFHTTLAAALNSSGISQSGMGQFEIVRSGVCLLSELEYVNLTYEEAMEIEEKMVKKTLHPKGLNMIPGGFAGMKFLHKLGYLSRDRVSVEDRDFASAKYLIENSAAGRIAPWVSEKWAKDEYYEQVIFKRSNTLSKEQVTSIRKFGIEWGFSAEIIANLVSANIRQVRDVLSGKYYSRVK